MPQLCILLFYLHFDRIDRLGAIILNDFLPFYEHWDPAEDRPLPRDDLMTNMEAHRIWDSGTVWRADNGTFNIA